MAAVELRTALDHIRYSRNVAHGYSRAIQRLFDYTETYIDEAENEARRGRKAVWTQGQWEIPLIYASDTIPVAFSEVGRISDQRAITMSEDYFQVPSETCSMVKATLGEWYLRKDAPIKRIFGSSVMCEPYNLAWEIIKNEGYDVFNLDVVYRAPGVEGERYDQLVKYFVEEIYRFYYWLSGTSNIDEEKLTYEIRRKNSFMAKIRKIMDLRIKHPLYIKSLAVMYLLNGLRHNFGKPEAFSDLLDELIEELESQKEGKDEQDRIIPLVWTGGNGQEFAVYQTIDEAGGALLGFVSTPYAKDYREDVYPVESLARFLLDSQWAGAAIYQREVIEQQIKKVNARGLILYGYLGCSFGSVAREMWRDYFHKNGIPSINLEGTFQTGDATGQILTRIKAFIEMLA